MRKRYRFGVAAVAATLLAAGSDAVHSTQAQDITAFTNGYLTFANTDTNYYWQVEFRPNLTGSEEWDGTFSGLRNIKSSEVEVAVPVGVFYRVHGRATPWFAGTALPSDILSGRTAYVNDQETTGTMANVGQVNIPPGMAAQTIPQGYHDGTGEVAGDAGLAPANIRAGATIFGVAGKPEVVDTTSGDAVPSDLLAGKKAWVDGAEVTGSMAMRTLSATGTTVQAGYYAAATLTEVDADLAAGNIKKDVTVFGVTGTHEGGGVVYTNATSAVPKTGQTTSYASGDDGYLEKGVSWPSPRFTDNSNGTVKDNLTGLIWLKNANAFDKRNWATALSDCATLNSGEAGLSDGSVEGDWRLPNVRELHSLIDYGRINPALPSGHPFTYVQMANYWSSSTTEGLTGSTWCVYLGYGSVYYYDKKLTLNVLPLRGGQ